MEHLRHPLGGEVKPYERVPLVCDPSTLDHGPFLTYPLRARPPRPQYLCAPNAPSVKRLEEANPTPTKELEAFFQEWLFFGFLQEFFGEAYSHELFVYSVDSSDKAASHKHSVQRSQPRHSQKAGQKWFVSTAKLGTLLKDWTGEMFKSSLAQQTERYNHLHTCATLVNNALDVVSPGDLEQHARFNGLVRVSIAAVAETIVAAVQRIFRSANADSRPFVSTFALFYSEPGAKSSMTANGWCPKLVHLIYESAVDLSMIYYLSRLKKLDSSDHSKCSPSTCVEEQGSAHDISPGHRKPDCRCQIYSVNEKKLAKILQAGSIPLLRIRFGDSEEQLPDVDLVSARDGLDYVAISHVWAEGLGNSLSNAIPYCQLSYLKQAVDSLLQSQEHMSVHRRSSKRVRPDGPSKDDVSSSSYETKNSEPILTSEDGFSPKQVTCQKLMREDRPGEPVPFRPKKQDLSLEPPGTIRNETTNSNQNTSSREILLWLDTLCCPVQPPGRKRLALRRMRDVYKQASDVLVLVGALQAVDLSCIDMYEAFIRLHISIWTRRLWTLQESYLATNLWVQCKDAAFLFKRPEEPVPLLRDSYFLNRSLDLHVGAISTVMKPVIENGFVDAVKSSQNRFVSVPSDEPLCIATLLDLDLVSILQFHDHESRMLQLWRLLADQPGGIPWSLIFHRSARLTRPGFRWAPATLLEAKSTVIEPFSGHYGTGVLSPDGLAVNSCGFTFSFGTRLPPPPIETLDGFSEKLVEGTFLRSDEGDWFLMNLRNGNLQGMPTTSLQYVVRHKPAEEFVLLVRGDFDKMNIKNIQNLDGLIGITHQTASDVIKVESIALVRASSIHRSWSESFEVAYQCAESLRQGEVWRELVMAKADGDGSCDTSTYEEAIERLSDQIESLAKHHARNSKYKDITGGTSVALRADFISPRIRDCLRGQYGRIHKKYSSQQQWCVD